MREILLTQNKVALVDDSDYIIQNQFNWMYSKNRSNIGCATRHANTKKRETLYLHREIMNTPKGVECDHRDGDSLNCQRYNLRNCTHQQNMMNVVKRSGTTSKYKGVHWAKNISKWNVSISVNKKRIYLGTYDDEDYAAEIYNVASIKHHGEFAKLNIIEKGKLK